MNHRPPDWPNRLAAFLVSKEHAPFAWGKNDCCLFTADWLLAITDLDPATGIRGTYDSALSAARVLEAMGGVDGIADAAFTENNWPEISIKLAGRGDIVTKAEDHGSALGVCVGERSAFPGPNGIVYYPTLSCARAWRIT